MKALKLIIIFYPFILLSQNEETVNLINLQADYLLTKNYDSLRAVCIKFVELDKKAAKDNNADYYLALSYFKLENFTEAIKQCEKTIPKIYIKGNSRNAMQRNMKYQSLCFELYSYYYQQSNYKLAFKNLLLINKKYNRLFCGNSRKSWQSDLYAKMIECSNNLGKQKRAKRIEGKLNKLNE